MRFGILFTSTVAALIGCASGEEEVDGPTGKGGSSGDAGSVGGTGGASGSGSGATGGAGGGGGTSASGGTGGDASTGGGSGGTAGGGGTSGGSGGVAGASGGSAGGGGTPVGGGGAGGTPVGGGGAPVGGGGGGGVTTCPPGEFAVGVNGGALVCTPLGSLVRDWVNQNCYVYYGWRDSCDACLSPPAKWGRTSDVFCEFGAGLSNVCITPSLGGETVHLWGLNPDGDVDGNDKLYIGFHCTEPPASPPGQCPAGQFVSSITGSTVSCSPIGSAAQAVVNQDCSLYAGASDNCSGCQTPPAKWGQVNDTACQNGAGANNTCIQPVLGPDTIRMFGLNTDGDVNDDDQLYLGMHCAGSGSPVSGQCPAGQLMTGFTTSPQCAPIDFPLHQYLSNNCFLYSGWMDGCNGCSSPPVKWGRVNDSACQNGAGADNTCSVYTLNGENVQLFGLNTDGDVNDDDKLFYGFKCF